MLCGDIVVEEYRFFQLYIEHINNNLGHVPVAYGCEMALGGMKYIDDMVTSYPNCSYLMTDWSTFYKNVPPWLIRDAFRIILENFD